MRSSEAKRSTSASRVFIAILAVACVAMSVVGWRVVGSVRQSATETDRRIRTLGWAVLSYVTANDGSFPLTIDELRAVDVGRDSLSLAPSAEDDPWPTSREQALAGADPATLEESLHSILVLFGEDRGMPPFLRPDGLPTSVGTGPDVNGWLRAIRAHYARGSQQRNPQQPE